MIEELRDFDEVWAVDFEFIQPDGETIQRVVCMVAEELNTGRVIRLWEGEFGSEPPFRIDARSLLVAYFASAELESFLALGWKFPKVVLDLYPEHLMLKNNLPLPERLRRKSLTCAMEVFGLSQFIPVEKEAIRERIIAGGTFNAIDRKRIIDYCGEDVRALIKLLPAIVPMVPDLGGAFFRGEYMKSVATMQRNGIPVDVEIFELMKRHRTDIRSKLIEDAASRYPVYQDGVFKQERFAQYLSQNNLLNEWSFTPAGMPKSDASTLRDRANVHPELLMGLKELVSAERLLKANKLAYGADGRSRCLLSPFGSRTGRNQPSNSKFMFGPSCFLRGLIRPARGHAIAYVDWSQQEIAVAAKLSGDKALIEAYSSGDPYWAFAQMAKAVPDGVTKDDDEGDEIRTLFKRCMLAVNYGMGAHSLKNNIGGSLVKAEHLIMLHSGIYRTFWEWSRQVVNGFLLRGHMHTELGWRVYMDDDPNLRSAANFPCQANGAECMRVAAILLMERGIRTCCPVHDAFLVEGTIAEIEDVVAETQECMLEAGKIVLEGFELRSDAKIVRYPEAYMDKRGRRMWNDVMRAMEHFVTPYERKWLRLA